MPRTKAPIPHLIAQAVLLCLKDCGWEEMDLNHIAKACKISHKEMDELVPAKADLIPMIVAFITEDSLSRIAPQAPEAPLEDRLFDVFMGRFESLQVYRDGVIYLAERTRRTPELALRMYESQRIAMLNMLTQIQTRPQDKRGEGITPHILLVIYHWLFLQWSRDTSPDLALTMRAVNKIAQAPFLASIVQRT